MLSGPEADLVEFLEPGVVAGAFDAVAAVARGDVEAAYTTAGFSAGEIPAIMAFFAVVPFGAEVLQGILFED